VYRDGNGCVIQVGLRVRHEDAISGTMSSPAGWRPKPPELMKHGRHWCRGLSGVNGRTQAAGPRDG
jgi:hypothetical protein